MYCRDKQNCKQFSAESLGSCSSRSTKSPTILQDCPLISIKSKVVARSPRLSSSSHTQRHRWKEHTHRSSHHHSSLTVTSLIISFHTASPYQLGNLLCNTSKYGDTQPDPLSFHLCGRLSLSSPYSSSFAFPIRTAKRTVDRPPQCYGSPTGLPASNDLSRDRGKPRLVYRTNLTF
jgi:hypothetical protein